MTLSRKQTRLIVDVKEHNLIPYNISFKMAPKPIHRIAVYIQHYKNIFLKSTFVLLSRRRTHKEFMNPRKSTLFIKPWFDLVVAKNSKCKRTKNLFIAIWCKCK